MAFFREGGGYSHISDERGSAPTFGPSHEFAQTFSIPGGKQKLTTFLCGETPFKGGT